MADERSDLVLEDLHEIRGPADDLKHKLDAAGHSLTRVETTITDIHWPETGERNPMAPIDYKIDRMSREIDDLELQLGMAH